MFPQTADADLIAERGTLGDMVGDMVGKSADEDELAAAYRTYGSEIYRFALCGLGDPGAAQDVTQETPRQAWRNVGRYDFELVSRRVAFRHRPQHPDRPCTRGAGGAPAVDAGRLAAGQELAGDDAGGTGRLLDAVVLEMGMCRLDDRHYPAIVETHLKDRPYDEVQVSWGSRSARCAVGSSTCFGHCERR